MARVFTVNFEFRKKMYVAVLSQTVAQAEGNHYKVSLYDDTLQTAFGNNQISFALSCEPTHSSTQVFTPLEELAQCIRTAICNHWQKKETAEKQLEFA